MFLGEAKEPTRVYVCMYCTGQVALEKEIFNLSGTNLVK